MKAKRFFEIYIKFLSGEGIDFKADGIKKGEILELISFAQAHLSTSASNSFAYSLVAEVLEKP